MAFSLKFSGDGLPKFEEAVRALGSAGKASAAYRMALNKTNGLIYTQVKRAVAGQMGVTQAAVIKHGALRKKPASNGDLVAEIKSAGKYLPLGDFKPTQRKGGASAAPWHKRRIFGGTFVVASLGGNVFKRTGKWNEKAGRFNGIEKLFGPAVPKELVKDESEAAFYRIARSRLGPEIARQVARLTKGAVT